MAWNGTRKLWLGLGAGVVVGLVLADLWPRSPLYAVSTDRTDNLVITTVPVDESVEAIFVLDSLTGTLRGGVPSYRAKGVFQATWERNVNGDLLGYIKEFNAGLQKAAARRGGVARPELQVPQSPKYMMTSGLIDMRGVSASTRPGRSMLYVVEATSGVVLAYVVPWSAAAHSAGTVFQAPLDLWTAAPFTTAVIRSEE